MSVPRAESRLARAAGDVELAATFITDEQLAETFGPGAVEAVRRMNGRVPLDRVEASARALAEAVEWSPAGLPEGDKQVLAFACCLIRLGAALKALDVARLVVRGEAP